MKRAKIDISAIVLIVVITVAIIALSYEWTTGLFGTVTSVNEGNSHSYNELMQIEYSNCNICLLDKDSLIAQSFRSPFSTLTSVSFVATGTGNEEVILHIREDNINGRDIVNMTKKINDAIGDKWVEWDFSDVFIDRSKMYYFVFECPKCIMHIYIPETINRLPSHTLCLWYQKNNVYPDGNYWHADYETKYLRESESDWDIAFKLRGY